MKKLNEKFKKQPRVKLLKVNEKGASVLFQNLRATFVDLSEPNTYYADKDKAGNPINGTFGLTMLIPEKSPTTAKFLVDFKAIIEEVAKLSPIFKTDKERAKYVKRALKVHEDGSFLKDGNQTIDKERKIRPGHEGHLTFQVSAKAEFTDGRFVPKVAFQVKKISENGNVELRSDEIADEMYNGIWVDVVVTIKGFQKDANKWIVRYMGDVLKLADDERLGGSDHLDDRSSEMEDDDEDEDDEEVDVV